MADADRYHGYDRGWCRYSFETEDFHEEIAHGAVSTIRNSIIINRGYGKPHIAFGIIAPDSRNKWPAIGLHIHRDNPTNQDVEEWYIIVEGTGVQRFTNGDSVEFGPGDLIACYPGTGHSLEATGDVPVRLISITPNMFTADWSPVGPWPETFEPRIRVLAADETMGPLTARCADCGSTWERPAGDTGGNTLADWASEHPCTKSISTVNLGRTERLQPDVDDE
jgi:mannose-6-phosphate isomerase-like protein (cupin superfamily)